MTEEINQLKADKEAAIAKAQSSEELIKKYEKLILIHKDIIKQADKTVNWIDKTIAKMSE